MADPEEIPKRVPHFVERAGHYFQNWDDLYENNRKTKMMKVIEEIDAMDFTDLSQMEDINVIKNGLDNGSAFALLKKHDKLIDIGLECWQYHFEFLNLILSGAGDLLLDPGSALTRRPRGNAHRDVGRV